MPTPLLEVSTKGRQVQLQTYIAYLLHLIGLHIISKSHLSAFGGDIGTALTQLKLDRLRGIK